MERDNLPRWDGRRGRYEVWFLALTVDRLGVAELVSEGTTHAEWAGRTPAPGVHRVHTEVA